MRKIINIAAITLALLSLAAATVFAEDGGKLGVTGRLGFLIPADSDLGNFKIETDAGFNYGGGLKVKPAGPIGVRFDARGYSVFGVQSQTLKLGEVTVGVLFGF